MIRYIYVFFVGLFLAIFIGIGIGVLYSAPQAPLEPIIVNGKELTQEEQKNQTEFMLKQREYDSQMQVYNRNVSIISLLLAVVILVTTLVFSDRLGLVADGLLLGGIFTLLYGIGRGMASDSDVYRFLVAGVGLAVTIVLGYIKFGNNHSKADN